MVCRLHLKRKQSWPCKIRLHPPGPPAHAVGPPPCCPSRAFLQCRPLVLLTQVLMVPAFKSPFWVHPCWFDRGAYALSMPRCAIIMECWATSAFESRHTSEEGKFARICKSLWQGAICCQQDFHLERSTAGFALELGCIQPCRTCMSPVMLSGRLPIGSDLACTMSPVPICHFVLQKQAGHTPV